MSDTIYRQDAIDAHCELCPDQHICCPIHNGNICPDIEVFRLLPSAQPQWIPCSERLPEKKQSLLVTVADEVSPYTSDDEWTGTGFWAYGKRVSAWMPLPKPYGGESE